MSSGTVSPPDTESSSHPISLEEFRKIYVDQQRMRFRQTRSSLASSPESLPNQDNLNGNNQDQQQQQTELQQDVYRQRNEDRDVYYQQIREYLVYFGEVAAKVFMATLLFFHTFTLYNLMIMLGVYIGWFWICRLLSLVQIDRENPTDNRVSPRETAANAPGTREAVEGDNVKKESGQVKDIRRVSALHRVLYIAFRCLTSFVLSISPTFSVEQLELELEQDGILASPSAASGADVHIHRN